MLAGAILVQHSAWANAERALDELRRAGALDTAVLAAMPEDHLASLIRVSGTPAVKARRLRALARTVERAGGITAFLALSTPDLRAALLSTHGIGPETADAVLLYAAGRQVFEIDAYTRRLFRRLGLGPSADSYDDWQRYFEQALGRRGDASMFQRYHAYIVLHCKLLCRTGPRCAPCPLLARCPEGQARMSTVVPTGAKR